MLVTKYPKCGHWRGAAGSAFLPEATFAVGRYFIHWDISP
jgi:hypothetical protein